MKGRKLDEYRQKFESTYKTATAQMKEIPDKIGIIEVSHQRRISFEGAYEGYFFNYENDEKYYERMDDVEVYLNDRGYRKDISKCSYGVTVFIHDALLAEYEDGLRRARECNNNIVAARKELICGTLEYIFDKFNKTYIRFGPIPGGGKSYNFRDEVQEDGVSCFAAVKIGNKYICDVAGGIFTYYGYADSDKQAFEISGNEIAAKGGDGEPLLKDATVVRPINSNNIYDVKEFISTVFGGSEKNE